MTIPYDGQPATVGNGAMVAFRAPTHETLRNLHAQGLGHGGADEGARGFREAYGADFFVGYLRVPDGNKVALFCSSASEPTRPW